MVIHLWPSLPILGFILLPCSVCADLGWGALSGRNVRGRGDALHGDGNCTQGTGEAGRQGDREYVQVAGTTAVFCCRCGYEVYVPSHVQCRCSLCTEGQAGGSGGAGAHDQYSVCAGPGYWRPASHSQRQTLEPETFLTDWKCLCHVTLPSHPPPTPYRVPMQQDSAQTLFLRPYDLYTLCLPQISGFLMLKLPFPYLGCQSPKGKA